MWFWIYFMYGLPVSEAWYFWNIFWSFLSRSCFTETKPTWRWLSCFLEEMRCVRIVSGSVAGLAVVTVGGRSIWWVLSILWPFCWIFGIWTGVLRMSSSSWNSEMSIFCYYCKPFGYLRSMEIRWAPIWISPPFELGLIIIDEPFDLSDLHELVSFSR